MRTSYNKPLYLTGLYLLFFQFWLLKPIGAIGNDGFLVVTLVYLLLGVYHYRKTPRFKFPSSYYWCMLLIMLGIGLSMITANMFYNQTYSQSFVTYRTQCLMLTPLFLARISPSFNDMMKSLIYFTWIYIAVYIIQRIMPTLFLNSIAIPGRDGGTVVIGYVLLCFPLYYTLQNMALKFHLKDFIFVSLLITVIFLQENRSALFPVLILSGWMMLKIKSKYKGIIILFILLLSSIALYQVSDILNELIEQTETELANPKYNRNKAFAYFLYKFSPNVWCQIFGNGFLSAHTVPTMQYLMGKGIFNSDMGFLGYWNQFGIIPIIVFFYLYISAIVRKKVPLFLKLISIQSLVCALTISYFAAPVHMIFFLVFYYLYFLNFATLNSKSNAKTMQCFFGNQIATTKCLE